MNLVELTNVTKRYPSGTSSEIVPLRNVDLSIAEGERIILLGKSGSGKSTLLNLIAGTDTPTSGKIVVAGREITAIGPAESAKYRRKEVGFIFQSFNLFSTLTVGENVMLPLELLGDANTRRAEDILEAVGLRDQWNKYPEQLSGGEQQRVAIARALVKEPSLILADEPTGNLDYETGGSILSLIDDICRRAKATLIMVTHSTDAMWLADRTFRIIRGALIREDSP